VKIFKKTAGIEAIDIAKRLMDYGKNDSNFLFSSRWKQLNFKRASVT
jgi:glycine cleavage system protein P-like pyridoxal-binding family